MELRTKIMNQTKQQNDTIYNKFRKVSALQSVNNLWLS